MTSSELKRMFKKEGIRMWEVAEVLGIHEVTFGKLFRHETMPENKELEILAAVEEIKINRCSGHGTASEQEETAQAAAEAGEIAF